MRGWVRGWVGAKSSKVSNFKLSRGLMGKRWTDLDIGQTERERERGHKKMIDVFSWRWSGCLGGIWPANTGLVWLCTSLKCSLCNCANSNFINTHIPFLFCDKFWFNCCRFIPLNISEERDGALLKNKCVFREMMLSLNIVPWPLAQWELRFLCVIAVYVAFLLLVPCQLC